MKVKYEKPVLAFCGKVSLAIRNLIGKISRRYLREKVNEENKKAFYK
jgi:hypothetical protein